MQLKNLCNTCNKYYYFNDDDGNLLIEGCKLDIPLFTTKKAVICNSYSKIRRS